MTFFDEKEPLLVPPQKSNSSELDLSDLKEAVLNAPYIAGRPHLRRIKELLLSSIFQETPDLLYIEIFGPKVALERLERAWKMLSEAASLFRKYYSEIPEPQRSCWQNAMARQALDLEFLTRLAEFFLRHEN